MWYCVPTHYIYIVSIKNCFSFTLPLDSCEALETYFKHFRNSAYLWWTAPVRCRSRCSYGRPLGWRLALCLSQINVLHRKLHLPPSWYYRVMRHLSLTHGSATARWIASFAVTSRTKASFLCSKDGNHASGLSWLSPSIKHVSHSTSPLKWQMDKSADQIHSAFKGFYSDSSFRQIWWRLAFEKGMWLK